MTRLPVLLALLLTAAVGHAKDKPKDPPPARKPVRFEVPPTEFPNIVVKKLEQKRGEEPTEEQLAAYRKQFDPPALPKVVDTDKPLVKLAKAKLAAVSVSQQAFQRRVEGGINTGSEFSSYCELSVSLTAAADLVYEKPADRVTWYEHRLQLMKLSEAYYLARNEARDPNDPPEIRGIDPPYLLPLASAARLDAEIALLKLKEQIGK